MDNKVLATLQLRYDLSRALPRIDDTGLDLIISSLTDYNPYMSTEAVPQWLNRLNQQTIFEIERIPLLSIDGWYFDEYRNLRHQSGKFFSIEGIQVRTNQSHARQWSQPIIYQPEVGILGILCQKRDGILYFLMQAKIEPGNVNKAQLSPTVQATRSNYTKVHGGQRPPYLEHFVDLGGKHVIVDQLQSEQGARFLKKRNRNMIVEISSDCSIDLQENFCWLTLGQIKKLLLSDNIVNMDARTVLSCTQLKCDNTNPILAFSPGLRQFDLSEIQRDILLSHLSEHEAHSSQEEIISWFTNLKTHAELEVTRCNMDEVDKWKVHDWEIADIEHKFFKVIGVKARIGNREVSAWCQPLIEQRQPGIIGFIVRKINGVYHILVQAKLEAGNFDVLEMAPTVQCITGNYKQLDWELPYLDYFEGKRQAIILYSTFQSEEGGRFYQEQNRNIVVEVGDDFPIAVEHNYIWMTLCQAKEFIKYNNYFNIEARNLITHISVI